MNPVMTRALCNNSYWLLALCKCCKELHLAALGFLDPPLYCNKFAAKAVGWFSPNSMAIHTVGGGGIILIN